MEKTCIKNKYPNLFSPIRIGNIRMKNRIIAAPTSPQMITNEGHFTDEIIAYMEEKALGGAAVCTFGEAIVHSATGKSHNKQIQLDSFGIKLGLGKMARAIHNAGGYANIQLAHGGMFAGLASLGGTEANCTVAYGPSAITMPQGEVLEMPKEMIYEIIDAYGKAALLCKDCGFDMVQMHAAHGWLISQFLSPVYNKRTDEFGGSLENRARILTMALDSIRKYVGPAFPIEIRLSGDDLSPNGLTMEECIEVAKLVNDKVDLFNISCGNHEDPDLFQRTHPSAWFPRGVNVYLAAEIKKHVTKPVACVGSLNDPAQMEEIIASGKADIVEIGRALLADPYLPKKALEGRADDITPCLRCYECFGEIVISEGLKCSVNPTMGFQMEEKLPKAPPTHKKRVLIAGGGPAGMEAAIVCAGRGHDVTLVEKAEKLGGNLYPAGAAFFKKDIIDFCNVMIKRVHEAGVKVVLNTEVTPEYVKEFAPDTLFVAIGSNELKPPIKGIDLPNVVMAIDAELHPEKLGKRVAVMGGGMVGTEGAISMASEGHECTVIEMRDRLATDVMDFYRGGLMCHFDECCTGLVNTKVKEITPTGVICERDGEEIFVEADTVVCALGFRAPYAQVDALAELVDEYYIIGDCHKVGKIYSAMQSAYFTATKV